MNIVFWRKGIRSLVALPLLFWPLALAIPELSGQPLDGDPAKVQDRRYQESLWKFRQRAYPLGYLPAGARERALAEIRRERARRRPLSASTSGLQWVNVGPAPIAQGQVSPPAPVSGRVTCIAVDPGNAAHWLVGAAQGGVWETIDSGTTWSPKTDDQPSLAMGALAFAPSNPAIIFAGTGEPNSSDSYPGAGLLKSADGGKTWQTLGTNFFAKTSFSTIRVNPTNANELVVATAPDQSVQLAITGSSPLPPIPANGVFHSQDGGTNWTRTLTGPAIALEVQPGNFRNQYAAVEADFNSGTPGALYRSPDGGNNWTQVNGPWGTPFPARAALAISVSSPDTLYVCFVDNDTQLTGIWRTDNAWSATPTWTALPTPSSSSQSGVSQLTYNLALSVDPTRAGTLYFAELALWKYDGTTWTTLAGYYDSHTRAVQIHSDQHALAWAGNRLLVGNDGGIWSTPDGGKSFASHNTTLATIQFYYGSVHPSNPNVAMGGAQDNGTSMWLGTNGWQRVGPGDGSANAFSPSHPDTNWLVSWQFLSIQRLERGGQYQTYITDPAQNRIDLSAGVPFVAVFAICPANENRVIAGTASLWLCDNIFNSANPRWRQNSPAQWITVAGSLNYDSLSAVAFAPSDDSGSTYAFATGSGRIQITTSGGGTNAAAWVDATAGGMVPSRYVTALAFDATNPNILYVTLSGFNEGTPNKPGHLFRTRNALAASPSWANIGPPVNLPHNCLAVDPANPNTIYVGTDLGVWQTLDGGASWTHFGPESGMPNVAVYDLKIHPRTGRVFAFTHGRSTFVLDPNVVSAPPAIAGFSPTNGPAGTTVTIRGTKFDAATAVRFNGVDAARFTLDSPTNITATVPAAATTGPISVTTPTGTAVSAISFVISNVPAILAFSPQSGNVGTVVTLTGVNFNGTTSVRFGAATASAVTVNGPTQVTATVPTGATSGRITLTTPAGVATSADVFSVTNAPVITGVTPPSGGVGMSATLTGANFTGATAVYFNNVSATFNVVGDSQVTATVPAGALSGPVAVVTPFGTANSPLAFIVIPTPAINGFSPASGAAGTRVVLTGANFTGATAVLFNGVTAPGFLVNSTSQLVVNVPVGATSGALTVQTGGGNATSSTAFTVLAPSPNDNFAAAQNLSGDRGTASGNNAAATKEPGEPDHAGNEGGSSIWYRWTATANGIWTFTTQGSDFDTVLAVYTGNAVSNLSPVASNDDVAGTNWSSVTFAATAGTTYQIAVDGHKPPGGELGQPTFPASGNLLLSWQPAPAFPPSISVFTPMLGAPGTRVTISGTNFLGATNVNFNATSASFQVVSASQITATVPTNAVTGPISISTPGGTAVSLNSFAVLLSGPPPNDNFTAAQFLTGPSGTVLGDNSAATSENGEPKHAGQPGGKSIWFTWVAPSDGQWSFDTQGSSFDTLLAVYTGSNLPTLSLVASNDDSGVSLTSALTIMANRGVSYQIAVDGYQGAAGDVVLNWSSLSGAPSLTTFSPGSGGPGTQVLISGSGFTSAFAVGFGGVNSPSFTVNSASQISATVPSGAVTGPISVTTTNGTATSTANFVVAFNRAPNDNFANRIPLTGDTNALTASNVGCTKEAGEPAHAGNAGGRSIWWSWTAPRNATYRITTRGSDFDTVLAVYTGGAVGSLIEVVSDDDDPAMSPQSAVTFDATAGVTYQIAVDGYNGAAGHVLLGIYPVTPTATIYYTGFEATEGFSTLLPLSGQNGWKSQGSGADGVDYNDFGDYGQQAYVGFSSASPGGNLYVWQPLNAAIDTNTRPVIVFSTFLSIVDSTDGNYDDFGWDCYDSGGNRLFLLDFDNSNLKVYYEISGTNRFVDSGVTFDNRTIFYLEVRMDFARNRWTAYLNNVPIAVEQPLSSTAAGLGLSDIDAAWFQQNNTSGDNYMIFDDYWVRADVSPAPRLVVQPKTQSVTTGNDVTLFVVADSSLPTSYQWLFNGVALDGATNVTLDLGLATPAAAGSYSLVASNAAGSVTSLAAVLTVNPLPNLTSYKPSTWSDSIISTTTTNTTTNAPVIYEGQHVFVDWAVLNEATNTDIPDTFYTALYVDGVLRNTWRTVGLKARHYTYVESYDIGALPSGSHSLRIDTDTTDVVSETSKNDNTFARTFVVTPTNAAPIMLLSPTLSSSNQFLFTLTGTPLQQYSIDVSTDLTTWSLLLTSPPTDSTGSLRISDTNSTNFNRGFYRAHPFNQ